MNNNLNNNNNPIGQNLYGCKIWIILGPYLIYDSLASYDRLDSCGSALGGWYLTMISVVSLTIVLTTNSGEMNNHQTQAALAASFGCFYIIWNFVGIFKYIKALLMDSSCLRPEEKIFFTFYFVLISLIFIFALVGIYVHLRNLQALAVNSRLALDQFYVQVQKAIRGEEVDVAAFQQLHGDVIEKANFDARDERFMKEHCIKKYSVRESRTNSDICVICQSEFVEGEDVFEFPCCGHNFHWECIQIWFQKKRECPMCKGNLRMSFLKEMVARNRRDQSMEVIEEVPGGEGTSAVVALDQDVSPESRGIELREGLMGVGEGGDEGRQVVGSFRRGASGENGGGGLEDNEEDLLLLDGGSEFPGVGVVIGGTGIKIEGEELEGGSDKEDEEDAGLRGGVVVGGGSFEAKQAGLGEEKVDSGGDGHNKAQNDQRNVDENNPLVAGGDLKENKNSKDGQDQPPKGDPSM